MKANNVVGCESDGEQEEEVAEKVRGRRGRKQTKQVEEEKEKPKNAKKSVKSKKDNTEAQSGNQTEKSKGVSSTTKEKNEPKNLNLTEVAQKVRDTVHSDKSSDQPKKGEDVKSTNNERTNEAKGNKLNDTSNLSKMSLNNSQNLIKTSEKSYECQKNVINEELSLESDIVETNIGNYDGMILIKENFQELAKKDKVKLETFAFDNNSSKKQILMDFNFEEVGKNKAQDLNETVKPKQGQSKGDYQSDGKYKEETKIEELKSGVFKTEELPKKLSKLKTSSSTLNTNVQIEDATSKQEPSKNTTSRKSPVDQTKKCSDDYEISDCTEILDHIKIEDTLFFKPKFPTSGLSEFQTGVFLPMKKFEKENPRILASYLIKYINFKG